MFWTLLCIEPIKDPDWIIFSTQAHVKSYVANWQVTDQLTSYTAGKYNFQNFFE